MIFWPLKIWIWLELTKSPSDFYAPFMYITERMSLILSHNHNTLTQGLDMVGAWCFTLVSMLTYITIIITFLVGWDACHRPSTAAMNLKMAKFGI
jgi:hypothetical protein